MICQIIKIFVFLLLQILATLPGAKARGHRGHEPMVVGFTTTCAISAYHHLSHEFKPRSWRGTLQTTLCNKFVSDL